MKHIVSLSGGVSSAMAADRVINRYGREAVTLWFADTSWEDPDLYRFMADCMARWGGELVTYRDGRTPLEVAEDGQIIPNSHIAPCTRVLKIEPFVAYLATQPKPLTVYLGLDWTEMHRMDAPKRNYEAIDGVTVDYPLMWQPYEFRNYFDVVRLEWGIETPALYRLGFPHNNCFAGETRFVTDEGVTTLKEASGKRVNVLSSGGSWRQAEVRSFGIQSLLRVTVARGSDRQEIYATPEHRWFTYAGNRGNSRIERLTHELVPGMRLISIWGKRMQHVRLSAFGIAHGIVFGDGTRNTSPNSFAFVMLCGEKNRELIRYFPLSPHIEVPNVGVKVSDLPRYFKELPSIDESKSYLYGWLAGYFAADGSVAKDGYMKLSCASMQTLEFVRLVCFKLGIGTNPIRRGMRVGLGEEATDLYSLAFVRHTIPEEFFLLSEHRRRVVDVGLDEPTQRAPGWTVESVEDTDRVEEVYCAVVPDTHAFVLEGNILTGNCGGRCVKQGMREWKRLQLTMPERFAAVRDWETAQRGLGDARADYAILRDRSGGKSTPIPLADLETRWTPDDEKPVQEDMFACFCSY